MRGRGVVWELNTYADKAGFVFVKAKLESGNKAWVVLPVDEARAFHVGQAVDVSFTPVGDGAGQ